MQKTWSQRYCSSECRVVVQRVNWKSDAGNPKYKTREHRQERAKWVLLMATQGYLICAQPTCLMPDRTIESGDRWHLGHDETGQNYIGPTHVTCNVVDGAKRGRARQMQAKRWAV
jgi:hypothetical protein